MKPSAYPGHADAVRVSYCGVGNPFTLGSIHKGDAFLDIGAIRSVRLTERRGLGEKNGYSFLGFDFCFLIESFNFGTTDFVSFTMRILENDGIPVV